MFKNLAATDLVAARFPTSRRLLCKLAGTDRGPCCDLCDRWKLSVAERSQSGYNACLTGALAKHQTSDIMAVGLSPTVSKNYGSFCTFSSSEPKAQVHYCDHSVVLSLTFHIFDFSSKSAERNSTTIDWKLDLNVFYQVCVFWPYRKNMMAALASDWLRHVWLLIWNRWREDNETWQEARYQRSLPSLCFWADQKTRWLPWP